MTQFLIHPQELQAYLRDKKCMFDMTLAQKADLVEILDSDDDEEDSNADLDDGKVQSNYFVVI